MPVTNLYSLNNTLSGYAKLGMLDAARRLFDKMTERDIVSWNTMVIGYAQRGYYGEAMRFYSEFRKASIGYNAFSFAGVLTIAVKSRNPVLSRQVHCQVLTAGFLPNVILSSSILDAYAKCGEMHDARKLFEEMQVRDVPAWTALISGYAKWGDMKSAQELFDIMPEKNPVSWTALIYGYARNNFGHVALEVFRKMMMFHSHTKPNHFTFSSCLSACGSVASLKHGKQIHAYMIRTGFRPNNIVLSSLIDMYSKCGSLKLSQQVFRLVGNKQDVMLWNPMIAALAQHGYGEEAIRVFHEMVLSGLQPNRVTFVIILSACSHSGLVDQGLAFFKSMSDDHGIPPDEEHYACIIDLLGRAGCIDELMNQLERMPCKNDDKIWSALVGVCQINENLKLGKQAAERLIELEPQSYAPYLLLSSIHAASKNWEEVERMRQLMDQKCVRKEQASSWIETNNKVERRKSLATEKKCLADLQESCGCGFPGCDYSPADRKNWMAGLGPEKLVINKIVWPGTHDSATNKIGIPMISRPFAQCQSLSIYEQLVRGTRVLDIRVQEDRRVCHGILKTYSADVVLDDVKKFLSETESEIIILEIRTEFGHDDPPEFDKYLVEKLGDYLIHQDDHVFRKTVAELLPKRVICIWKPRNSPAPKHGDPLWSGGHLKDNWIDTDLPSTKFESNIKHLSEQPPLSTRKFFYRVENTVTPQADNPILCVKPVTDRIHGYARLFITQCFSRGVADRLQVFSTDFIDGDFVDACAGLTHARIEGKA